MQARGPKLGLTTTDHYWLRHRQRVLGDPTADPAHPNYLPYSLAHRRALNPEVLQRFENGLALTPEELAAVRLLRHYRRPPSIQTLVASGKAQTHDPAYPDWGVVLPDGSCGVMHRDRSDRPLVSLITTFILERQQRQRVAELLTDPDRPSIILPDDFPMRVLPPPRPIEICVLDRVQQALIDAGHPRLQQWISRMPAVCDMRFDLLLSHEFTGRHLEIFPRLYSDQFEFGELEPIVFAEPFGVFTKSAMCRRLSQELRATPALPFKLVICTPASAPYLLRAVIADETVGGSIPFTPNTVIACRPATDDHPLDIAIFSL